MGWSTELFCNISFNRETYTHKEQVQDDIDECNNMIQLYQNELRDYAIMTEPKKYFEIEEDESYYDILTSNIRDIFLELQEYIIQKYKLELLLDNWDKCHKGELAIPLPKNIKYNDAFLEGDFIKSIEDNNNNNQ